MDNKLTSLFLKQSYKDVNQFLKSNIEMQKYENWDFVVLTASNEEQAKNYRLQIDRRLKGKLLDERTKYVVIPDYKNKRVGSGGATLNVLRILRDTFGVQFLESKILLIHSGGDSKRIPKYSAVGKLFSSIPRELNRYGATLFDELIATSSIMVSRMNHGVMLMSGDVTLLYNPLQVEYNGGVCAVSTKKSVQVGKNHGVFLLNEQNEALRFLHKKSVAELTEAGAVDANGNVDIDTGIILFDGAIADAMLEMISTDGKSDSDKVDRFVNDKIRLNFYGDFLYPFAKDSDEEEYLCQPPEYEMSDELVACRSEIWRKFRSFPMKVESVSPAEFLHFGTTEELLKLMTEQLGEYDYLGWQKNCCSNVENKDNAFYQVYQQNCSFQSKAFLENCDLSNCTVGSGTIISFVEADGKAFPSDCVFSGICLKNGKFVVRVYGVTDNPKLNISDGAWFQNNRRAKENISTVFTAHPNCPLWLAEVFPVCDSMKDALNKAILTYEIFCNGNFDRFDEWQQSEKISFADSFLQADSSWIDDFGQAVCEKIFIYKIASLFRSKAREEEYHNLFKAKDLFQRIVRIEKILKRDSAALSRLYYYISKNSDVPEKQKAYAEKAFRMISAMCSPSFGTSHIANLCEEKIEVRLPARVNFGGGWSDTPPYCVERGGTVLNAAITLNGVTPIVATIEKIRERKFIFESRDSDFLVETKDRDFILDCANPFDSAALPKAAIVTMGILNKKSDRNLNDVFDRLGGGLKLSTNVIGIPRGSGLGTSSILSAACVKALFMAQSIPFTNSAVASKVLYMEQLMSTGGGWQDQIGGLYEGVKIVKSAIGEQLLDIQTLTLSEVCKAELNRRFTLIYTGQRRLARNLLREIVGGYLMSQKKLLFALKKIEEIACLMQRALEKSDVDRFADLLNEHWEYSKMLDEGSTNTCIDYIFNSMEDLIDGKMICGAGGGGFLQVILKNNVSKEDLGKRLFEVFGSCGVKVYDSKFVF